MNPKIYLADLTHTNNGIMALTLPLGTAYVAAYCLKMFKDKFDIHLVKFPEDLLDKLEREMPTVLAFANYSWNIELSYEIVKWVKSKEPSVIIVFGGPNFPTEKDEQKQFLTQRNLVDFYIQAEGEVGFSKLLEQLEKVAFDSSKLKASKLEMSNCVYLSGEDMVCGDVERIHDVNAVPSPYLTGILDEFFELPLTPMVETTRGCPFRCSFCADGIRIKSKVHRFNSERVREELYYIANKVKKTDEIIVTDLNFGMYEQDIETAKVLAELQSNFNWPIIVKGSAGKNKQERIIEVAKLLKGSWIIGAAIQSSDKDVLININRSNISLDAYSNFLETMNSLDRETSTYTEIILGLPGDSKSKHFKSLRYAVESGVINVKSYQAMLLAGTEMANKETRNCYELTTKFRIMAGGVGIYKHSEGDLKVAEVQELIVGNKSMSFEDYVSCRKMNLIIEGFYNNSPYMELFSSFKNLGFPVFDLLQFLHSRPDLYTEKTAEIFAIFDEMTRSNLFDTYEEARFQTDKTFDLYLKEELGFNETLECKAMLYFSMEDSLTTLTRAIKEYLRENEVLTDFLDDYFTQLSQFVFSKKHDITSCNLEIEEKFYFDFAALDNGNFSINPQQIKASHRSIKHHFFHVEDQKTHITSSLEQYKNHSGGIARFIYSQNLKKMYRHVTTIAS